MLTEICEFLRNWFELEKISGIFSVVNGVLTCEDGSGLNLQDGQYYRVIGSVFNDGVHKWGWEPLQNENPFEGSVWPMSVPPAVRAISEEITEYMRKYGGVNSVAMSPYTSESYVDYSYSKNVQKGGTSNDLGTPLWFSAFGPRLMRWKKL